MDTFTYDEIAHDGHEFDSDAIAMLAYSLSDRELLVKFQTGGMYIYSDVAESTYHLAVEAQSVGRFYRSYILAKYVSRAVRPDAALRLVKNEETDDENGGIVAEKYDEGVLNLSGPLESSTFGVKYTMTTNVNGSIPTGPFEPVYQAANEAEAIVQFEQALAGMKSITGWDINVNVLSVTHYYE